MKKLLLLLFLSGCAHGVEDPLDPPKQAQDAPAPRAQVDPPRQHVKVCEVVETYEVRDCTLYELTCVEGVEFVLLCPPVNLGMPTNPPRPI